MGSKDTSEEEAGEGEDSESEVEELATRTGDVQVGGPPVAVSIRSPFGLGSASTGVARMPNPNNGGFEQLSAAPAVNYAWNPSYLKTIYQDLSMVMHQFVAILLPSGIGFESDHDFQLAMQIFGPDHYLNIEIQWPDTFERDDGEQFLSHLYQKKLKRNTKKWLEKKNLDEQCKAKKSFDATHVMLGMAVKQEMIRMRQFKGYSVLRSQTNIKMDFPVERLTEDCWELLGDDTGVRMVVVDLEQATADADYKQPSFERKVEFIS